MSWIWPKYTKPSDDTFGRLQKTISAKKQPAAALTKKVKIAEESLKSVIHLTEYEDDKANRILTAVAFLSAFAAVMFTETMDSVDFPKEPVSGCIAFLTHSYPYIYYGLFFFYALLMTWGAVLVIFGIRPSFNLPSVIKSGGEVSSLLFFRFILSSTPETWAETYRDKSPQELEQLYFENCVTESYLVAGKIPKKIAFVELGTKYFFASTIVLMFWVITTILAELLYKV